MTRSTIGENELECMAERAQRDGVAAFHGRRTIMTESWLCRILPCTGSQCSSRAGGREGGGGDATDVITFSVSHHDPSRAFWTACNLLISVCGSPARRLLQQST